MKRTSLHPRVAAAALYVLATSCGSYVGTIGGEPVSPDADTPPIAAEMVAAMERDLGLTSAEVHARLAAETTALRVESMARSEVGDSFAGAWMDESGTRLVVGITDPALAASVREAGAEPRLVRRSLSQLTAIKAELDERAADPDAAIHAWHVDVSTNTVVVQTADPTSTAVREFVADLDVDAVRLVASEERPALYYDIRGGDEYIINGNTLCSVGFTVHGGFVTAGHCGQTGSPTYGSNWVSQGTFRGSSFPGNDYAWVETNSNWNSLPWVTNHAGGAVAVTGSQVAPAGSSVCRSGRTTGWRCGVIQAHDVTVNYEQGPVYGTTKTNACAEPGDSGGAFISGNQAQGVTSGGSGNCSTGGTTFYQPVNEILSVYGLGLKTEGGGPIVSRMNDKCIDVPSSNFSDGVRLQMWGCNGTAAQRWTFTGGTIRAGGLCMDVAGANTADGTPIQLAYCNGHQAQQFVHTEAGDLVSVLANKCVDIYGASDDSGASLIIWPCHGGANQKWYRP
jgi:streptogrisin C